MTKKGTIASATEETGGAVAEEKKYPLEELRRHCVELYGVTSSTFDGAMHGHTGEKLTVNGAKAIIDKWLGKEGKK